MVLDTFANVLPSEPDLLKRRAVDGGATLPDERQVRAARAVLTPRSACSLHVPNERGAGPADRHPLGGRRAGPRPGFAHAHRPRRERQRVSVLEEQLPTDGARPVDRVRGTEHVVGHDRGSPGPRREPQLCRPAGLRAEHAGVRQSAGRRSDQDAQLRWALASVGAQLHKSRIDNRLVGRGSSVNQVEIGFGGGRQLFDLTSYTRHIGQDTTGDLLSKGVFLDRARGYFKGMIHIEHSARGTDSFLGEFAMLLAKQARSVTIPSLEIDQPDVRRASHAELRWAPIDETQVFYLMSRGIPREQARKFIVLGFLEPVVSRIPLPDAQERLRACSTQKWPASVDDSSEAAA